jgi:diaminopimelate decarboxylase
VAARMALFPISARIEGKEGQDQLTIAGMALTELAERYGTPLYLYDQETLDLAQDTYRQTLAQSYPAEAAVTYAGKAYLCTAMAQWVERRQLWLDCSSSGELGIAAAGGVSRSRIVLHGVNKSQDDLLSGLEQAGTIVVDNLTELERLIRLADGGGLPPPELWLRIRPGLAIETHTYIQTGQEDSKFGMNQAEALEAIGQCRHRQLPLTGLHFHLGSKFRDPTPLGPALKVLLNLAEAAYHTYNWLPLVVSPGGGWASAYHEEDLPHPAIEEYVRCVSDQLVTGCRRRGLPLPRLQMEPGRSLVARAGVALYRVGSVKNTAGRRWLLLDGGLADNPRPALYRARYTALPASRPYRPASGLFWLAGPYCESGDILIEALDLPELSPGEIIAIPVSGAYQLSMASNYNAACKPAVVWLGQGRAQLVQEREQASDLLRRDRRLAW